MLKLRIISGLRFVQSRSTLLLLLVIMGCYHTKQVTPSFVSDLPLPSTKPETAAVQPAATILPDCPNLPPICPGVTALLAADASTQQWATFLTNHPYVKDCTSTQPYSCTCRFQLPRHCYLGEKKSCKQQCSQ